MANNIRQLTAGSTYFQVMASAARTATPDTEEFEITGRGYEYSGLHLIIDATAVTATPALTVTVSGVDRVSGKTYTILQSAVIATAVTTVLRIGVGLTPAANTVASDSLPPVFRVTAAHGDADSITYSIGGMLV
ncbi:hypothetical protein [Streptomyces atriruber]|uniref:hypothetical protein n=1 Tax=Streptomyces atriruber TaxID=545121 RepID=UPI0006E29EAB|nr:hypothetical protein [Streptomyces atriruber]